MLKAARLELHHVAFQSRLLYQVLDGIGDAVGQDRFAVDLLRRLLRVQGQERSFRVNDAIADFYFLLLVHEGFADVGVVTVAERCTANERRPIRDRLLFFSRRQILTGRENRRRGADRTDRRHVDVPGRERDERTGRARVRVDEGVGRDRGVIQNAR